MGFTRHGLRCTRVRVQCGKTRPAVYPCGTLVAATATVAMGAAAKMAVAATATAAMGAAAKVAAVAGEALAAAPSQRRQQRC